MKLLSVAHHTGGNRQDRWTVNGKRVARHVYENLVFGASRRDCLLTEKRQGGRIVHSMSIHILECMV